MRTFGRGGDGFAQIVSDDTFKRPMYAGNSIATIRSKDIIKVTPLLSSSFVFFFFLKNRIFITGDDGASHEL